MVNKPIREDSITGIGSFLLSIDWEEPWLYVLVSFHIWCALATICTILYRHYYPQIVLFVFYLGLAYCSEYINTWAAANYKLFSEQQYFDSRGMFISLVLSLPLLCNTVVIVFYWMYDVTCTMINLKRAKVRQSRKAKELVAQKENEAKSTENETKSTENEAKSTENEAKSTENVDKSKESNDEQNTQQEVTESGDGEKGEQVDEKTAEDKKED